MVDQETKILSLSELEMTLHGLAKRTRALEECNLPERVRDLEVMTRSGSTPAQWLVPRNASDSLREELRLLKQTARDRLAKIEHLETELASLRHSEQALYQADGVKGEALEYVKKQREMLKEELTDANVKIEDYSKRLGEALLERDHFKAAANDRADTLAVLRAQVRAEEKRSRELADGMTEMRAENERLRRAHATACTEVSKLAAERDMLQRCLHVRKGKGHE